MKVPVELVRAIDGDTAEVMFQGQKESIRFHSVDCEESAPGLGKPMTTAGVMAKKFTFQALETARAISIELDFPRDLELEEAKVARATTEGIALSRDRYGRLIAHIYIDDLHLNHELVRLGYSPYFNKYGNSRLYHRELNKAQAQAINDCRIILMC